MKKLLIPNKILNLLSLEKRQEFAKLVTYVQKGRQDPVLFAEKLLGLHLHYHQKLWLWLTTKTQLDKATELAREMNYSLPSKTALSEHNFKKNVLVPSNRWGKTFITAVKHLWHCFYKIGMEGSATNLEKLEYTTLNLASHSEQSDICFNYIEKILTSQIFYPTTNERNNCRLGFFLGKVTRNPINIVHFNNNSKFSSRTIGEERASNIQGSSQYYISFDECCRSYNLEKELEPNIMPRLADTNGALDLLSTPDKDSPSLQFYYEVCELGKELKEGWYLQTGQYDNNVFIPESIREAFKKQITDPMVRKQVLYGDFIFTGGKMFSGEDIRKIWHKDLSFVPLNLISLVNQQAYGIPRNISHRYLVAVDFARSEGGDATVIYGVDLTFKPYQIVYSNRFLGVPIMAQVKEVENVAKYYGAELYFDATGFGGQIMEDLLPREAHPVDFSKEKANALAILKLMLSENQIIAPSPDAENELDQLRRELSCYKLEDKKLSTDCVMALAIAAWGIDDMSYVTKPIYFNLYK